MSADPSTRGHAGKGLVPVTYDLVPPCRPSVDDMGGAKKKDVDPPRTPPHPVRSVTSKDWNQMVQQVAEATRAAPVAILTIKFVGVAPVIEQVAGMGTKARDPATYTVSGNTSTVQVTWPAGTFPGRICRHTARIAGVIGGGNTGSASPLPINNGVVVNILDSTGGSPGAPYSPIVLSLYGQ